MTDIVAWLREQLDNDEQWAQEAIQAQDPRMTTHEYAWSLVSRLDGKVKRQTTVAGAPTPIERLAEVGAKRRILDEAIRLMGYDGEFQFLEMLALSYADRAGYREEWRP